MINFKINGISVKAQKGETILQVARREDIYIPTMCYLAKATPNASCRMCVVEAEGVDGFILSCNTPPTEGIEITTNTNALESERVNIMKLYDVNHPLECGVCDKSGECDLQNKTLEFGLDEQSFAVRDQARKKKKWGVHTYDPGLCILCEKCTTVCNEVVGNNRRSVVAINTTAINLSGIIGDNYVLQFYIRSITVNSSITDAVPVCYYQVLQISSITIGKFQNTRNIFGIQDGTFGAVSHQVHVTVPNNGKLLSGRRWSISSCSEVNCIRSCAV